MTEPCTACLEGHCALHEHGTDPNTFDVSAIFGPDVKKSVQIWHEQDLAEADQRRRLIAELQYQEAKNRF
jgi:hypothetical protein